MKRNVYADGNDSGLILVEGMGEYAPRSRVVELETERDQLAAQNFHLHKAANALFRKPAKGGGYIVLTIDLNKLKMVADEPLSISLAEHDAQLMESEFDRLAQILEGEFGDRAGGFMRKYAVHRPDQLRQQAQEGEQ
ncbi:hypothetical protein [Marinobacterium jannaschii]|uniref:hypothetical protein n=1 Tax=Marinobacterium jannaschii TaxID=64970 RepID=UPI00047FF1EF|nr:hypothetical protein [Marinobacterium jannaschii]